MISNFVKGLINKQEVQAQFPFLIKITHEDYGTFLYCNASHDITYDGETYQQAVFKITPPEITATSVGNATLTMSTVDQEWIAKIRGTQKRANVRFIAAIVYQNGGQVIEPLFDNEFVLTQAQWTEISVTWTMVFDDKWDINIPCQIMDSLNAPGVA